MKALLIGTIALLSITASANESIEKAAIEAYEKSEIAKTNAPCAGKVKPAKAILLEGGGDVFPQRFEVLVAQEFNCTFYRKSLLTKVIVSGNFNSSYDQFIFTADAGSVRIVELND